MLRIGEFSKLTQVTIRMLRYYDEVGLLKPAQIDSDTGYRLYSVEQIPVLNKIIYLRDSGFHISEIAAVLHNGQDCLLMEQLDKKYGEIEQIIVSEQNKLDKIKFAKMELAKCKNEMYYNISIKSIPSYQVFSYRKVVPDYYAEGLMWKEMSLYAKKHQIACSNHTFSIYHDPDYRETDVDIEVCAPVDQWGADAEGFQFRITEPVPMMACTMVYGAFTNIAGAYLAFARWIQEHGQYRMGESSRQMVHRGPWNEKNPQNYLTEIQIPLRK